MEVFGQGNQPNVLDTVLVCTPEMFCCWRFSLWSSLVHTLLHALSLKTISHQLIIFKAVMLFDVFAFMV